MRQLLLFKVIQTLPIILAMLALVGWASDIELLKRGMTSSVAMNPTTAVCMILLAFEAIRLNIKNCQAVLYKAGQMAVIIVIVVSTMKLGDIVFGSSFAIDQQLFSAKLNTELDHHSRMAPNTAAGFLALGLAMQFMRGRSDSSALKAQLLAVVAMLLALLALIGHMFDTLALSGMAHYIPMAINTALAFLIISASVLFTYPDKGFMRVFVSQDSSGSKTITNILLPASILIPLVFGLLNHIGADRGFFDMEFALALTVLMNIVALLSLSYISAQKLFLSDIARRKIETALHDSELHLRTIVETEPECVKTLAADGTLLSMNRAGLDMIEADSADQVIGRPLTGVIEPAYLVYFNALTAAAFRGESGNLEFKIRGLKGASRWLETRTAPLRDERGDITASLSVTRDITGRKQAEVLERQQFNELQAIYQISNAARGAESPDQVYEVAMESILLALKADRVSILLFDAAGVMRFVAWRGLSDTYRKAADGHSPWAQATVDPQPILVDDIELDAGWAHFLPVARAEGVSAFGFIPLVLHGHLFGKFMVYFNQPHRFTEDEARLAQTIASHISFATESKKVEAELLLRAQLLDSVSDTIFLLDLDGKFVYLNEAAWKTRGYTRDEMMGIDLHVLDTPKYEKLIADRFREIMEKGQCIFESEHRRKDGSVMPVEINARTIELGGHKRLLSIIRDITERKQVEGILAESEERYRALFEQGADPVWLIDAQTGAFVDFNTAAYESLGYTREEFARLSITDLEVMESPQEVALHIEKVRAKGFDVFETAHLTKHGELRHILVSVKTVTFGGAVYFQSIQRDITEHKEHEEELKRSNVDLEQFSYAVSHDMRQPLRMISSYLQLLERSMAGQLDGEKRSYFDFAVEGAKRIDQMLVDLLEYSRVGRMGEPPAWIESRAVLDEALQFLQPAIAEAQAKLNISGNWPRIFASHDEILRLLQNLIGNAIKYRIAGRMPEIAVTSGIIKNDWHLCVADNGVGIIPDQIKRLFQVFQRLQSREAYEGTGIGLALCRKIVEHHKGRIWAESAGEGKGSKFCAVLPVLRDGQSPRYEKTRIQ